MDFRNISISIYNIVRTFVYILNKGHNSTFPIESIFIFMFNIESRNLQRKLLLHQLFGKYALKM